MLKAVLAVGAVLLAIFSILSCGGDSNPPVDNTKAPQAVSFSHPVRITDAGGGLLAVTDYVLSRVVFVNSDTLDEVRHFTVAGKPLGIAVADNKVFVGIPVRTENGRQKGGNVNAYSMAGKYLYTLGSASHGYRAVKNPTDIAVDEADDRVFVLDAASLSVKVYMINGTFDSEFPVGSPSEPGTLAIDTANDLLYVGDSIVKSRITLFAYIVNSGIRTFDYAGNASPVIDVVDDLADEFRFSHPMGLDLDLSGNLLVSDIVQNRIVVINSAAQGVRAFAPDAVAEGTSFMPMDVHVGSSGDVIVSEGGNSRLTVLRGEGL